MDFLGWAKIASTTPAVLAATSAAMAALLLSNVNLANAEPIEIPEILPGLAITTALRPEGNSSGRDYVSYKRIVEIGSSDIVISYQNDTGTESKVIVPKENVRSGGAYGAGFAGRLAGRRNTSTALTISESIFDNLKASKTTDLTLGMERLWSKGKLSGVKSSKSKIIVDDTTQVVDTLIADFSGDAYTWEKQPEGLLQVRMEILDLNIYPIILHQFYRKAGSEWFSVQTVRLETGEPVRDRFVEGFVNEGRFTSYGITFDYDSDKIIPRMRETLDGIAEVLAERPSLKTIIEGHTDSDGSSSYNKSLSERRSLSVVNYLVKTHGIEQSRLSPIGYGEDRPIAANDTFLGRAQNRRVDFVKFE